MDSNFSRMLSVSHTQPRSLIGYEEFFRQNSTKKEGLLELKMNNIQNWIRAWFVFESGGLGYYSCTEDGQPVYSKLIATIPADSITAVRTNVRHQNSLYLHFNF